MEKIVEKAKRPVVAVAVGLAISLGATACSESGPKKQEKIVMLAEDSLKDSLTGTTLIARQKGVDTVGTPLSSENIKSEMKRIEQFVILTPSLDVVMVNTIDNSGDLTLNTQLKNEGNDRVISILKDTSVMEGLTGQKITALTTKNEDGPASFIALVGEGTKTRFDDRIDPNGFNRAVELCNSSVEIKLSAESARDIKSVVGQDAFENMNILFDKLNHEAVCNSYALFASSLDAGISYPEYKGIAEAQQLQDVASLGFTIPYLVFDQDKYNQISAIS